MRCSDCPYHWKDDGDDFAQCHFIRMFPPELDPAPCEVNDDEPDENRPAEFPYEPLCGE